MFAFREWAKRAADALNIGRDSTETSAVGLDDVRAAWFALDAQANTEDPPFLPDLMCFDNPGRFAVRRRVALPSPCHLRFSRPDADAGFRPRCGIGKRIYVLRRRVTRRSPTPPSCQTSTPSAASPAATSTSGPRMHPLRRPSGCARRHPFASSDTQAWRTASSS